MEKLKAIDWGAWLRWLVLLLLLIFGARLGLNPDKIPPLPQATIQSGCDCDCGCHCGGK